MPAGKQLLKLCRLEWWKGSVLFNLTRYIFRHSKRSTKYFRINNDLAVPVEDYTSIYVYAVYTKLKVKQIPLHKCWWKGNKLGFLCENM